MGIIPSADFADKPLSANRRALFAFRMMAYDTAVDV
jgi:hypothetical protein